MINYSEHKPSILIMTQSNQFETRWNQVLFGIEEEGIPYQVRKGNPNVTLEEQAYEAAHQSALAVGIASSDEKIVVHYKNLSKHHPLFSASYNHTGQDSELRDLGCNAARLVKGIPFKTGHSL